MTGDGRDKAYDLEERTFEFARAVRTFVKALPRTLCNQEDAKQLVRSSGSVGANYIEANEGLSKKDFPLRMRISRKESKESRYWLRLIDAAENEPERRRLIDESMQLTRILSAIIQKSQAR